VRSYKPDGSEGADLGKVNATHNHVIGSPNTLMRAVSGPLTSAVKAGKWNFGSLEESPGDQCPLRERTIESLGQPNWKSSARSRVAFTRGAPLPFFFYCSVVFWPTITVLILQGGLEQG
jgi:hypothetical protein